VSRVEASAVACPGSSTSADVSNVGADVAGTGADLQCQQPFGMQGLMLT